MYRIKWYLFLFSIALMSCEKQNIDLIGSEWICEGEYYDMYLIFTTSRDAKLTYDYKSEPDKIEFYKYEISGSEVIMKIGPLSYRGAIYNGDEYMMIKSDNGDVTLGLFRNTKYYTPINNPIINTTWSSEYTGTDEYGNVVSCLFMLGFQEDEASLSMTQIVVGSSEYKMLSYFLPYDYTYNPNTRQFIMNGKHGGFVTNGEDVIYFDEQGVEPIDSYGYLNSGEKSIIFWLSEDTDPLVFNLDEEDNSISQIECDSIGSKSAGIMHDVFKLLKREIYL